MPQRECTRTKEKVSNPSRRIILSIELDKYKEIVSRLQELSFRKLHFFSQHIKHAFWERKVQKEIYTKKLNLVSPNSTHI